MSAYEDLAKRLNEYSAQHENHGGITAEAADAIEKLEQEIDKLCKTNESLRRKIQRMKSDASWDEDIRRGQVQGMW